MPLPQPPAFSIPLCEIKRKAEEYGLKTQELDGGDLAIDVNSGDFTGFMYEIEEQNSQQGNQSKTLEREILLSENPLPPQPDSKEKTLEQEINEMSEKNKYMEWENYLRGLGVIGREKKLILQKLFNTQK